MMASHINKTVGRDFTLENWKLERCAFSSRTSFCLCQNHGAVFWTCCTPLLKFALSLAYLLHSFEALILWGLDCLPLLICLMPSRDVELCLLTVQFRIISETALN